MARRRALLCSSSAHSFVNQAESFRSVFTTAGTMFLILLGEFDYDEMKQEIAEISPRCPARSARSERLTSACFDQVNATFAFIFFVAYVLFMFFIVLNIFIAILNDACAEIHTRDS